MRKIRLFDQECKEKIICKSFPFRKDPETIIRNILKWAMPIIGITFLIGFWVVGFIYHYFFSLTSECK